MSKFLIVNADDFGASEGINRAVVDCHETGIVTSASLMVRRDAAADAVEVARAHPDLSVGLHWDDRGVDLGDPSAVREELHRQLARFHELLGRGPTHLDSHHHAHRSESLVPFFEEAAAQLGVPLRGDGRVTYVGGFFAQWEWQVVDLHHVSVEFLEWILREEVADGWTELGCHPGYPSPGFRSTYGDRERDAEVRTLSDPHVRETIEALGIRLASYADFNRQQAAAAAG